jgi:small subunit ribosomal protein S17
MPKKKLEKENSKVKGTLEGVVVSNKMQKTIVVEVSRFVKHPKYGKYYQISKSYKAHDEGNKHKVGERVSIVPTRPISKDKRFKVVE